MNANEFSRLIHDHEQFPGAIRILFEGVSSELSRERPATGKWSPLEILVHLRDEEIEDFRARATIASGGGHIELGIDPQGWVTSRDYNAEDPAAILESFIDERIRSIEWLRSLDIASLDRLATPEKLGPMRCGDFIAAWRMHDLLHLRQLATTLAKLEAKRLDSWKCGYAGPIPD